MRQLLPALLVCALVQPAAAGANQPEPRAIAVFVNLVLGACMAEKGGESLMPEPIDPRAVGVPVAADNDDPRLGPETLRVPSTDGAVYHDRDDESCYVYGDGIDAEAAVERIQEALKRSGVAVMAFSDGVAADADGTSRRTAVYGVMVSPRAPALPLVTLSYPVATPAALTAGVRAGRVD